MKLASLGPLLLALAACHAPRGAPAPHPAKPAVDHPPPPALGALPATPVATTHKAYTVVEAPHSGNITQIALTSDGTAAVSADDMGGIRLWPALDGTAEPRVVDLPPPKQLAIGHLPTSGGFVIAALDEAGGVYIAKLDGNGRKLSHVTLAPDPAYLGFEMSDVGLLAWRADQTIDLIDPDGATTARLPTEDRQRIVAVATAGKKAITIVETGAGTRAVRWLSLEPKLAWGATLNIGDDPGQAIALSPKGTHYAVSRHDERTSLVQLIDVAQKKVIASSPNISMGTDLAFLDDDVLAVGSAEGINWIDATLPQPVMSLSTRTTGMRVSTAVGAGGGHAITAQNGELVVATPSTTLFLGYDLISPRFVEPAGNGQLMIGLRDTFSYLDAHLHEIGTAPAFPAQNVLVPTQFVWIDGDRWLTEAVSSGATTSGIYLIDAKTGTKTELRSGLKEASILMYEPSTQMLTQSFGAIAESAHLDVTKSRLDKISTIAKVGAYEQIVLAPTSPKLAGGTQLVQVTLRDKPTIKWLKDARALDKAASSVTLDGSYAGTDAAGHVYMWRSANPGDHVELVVYADGKVITTLPAQGPVSLWPDATGARVVEVATNAVSLLETTTGKQLWSQELGAVQQALWLADGSLAITSASGIAKLDASSGAVTAARCGWRFGLSTKPHPPAARVEPLCAQLDR